VIGSIRELRGNFNRAIGVERSSLGVLRPLLGSRQRWGTHTRNRSLKREGRGVGVVGETDVRDARWTAVIDARALRTPTGAWSGQRGEDRGRHRGWRGRASAQQLDDAADEVCDLRLATAPRHTAALGPHCGHRNPWSPPSFPRLMN